MSDENNTETTAEEYAEYIAGKLDAGENLSSEEHDWYMNDCVDNWLSVTRELKAWKAAELQWRNALLWLGGMCDRVGKLKFNLADGREITLERTANYTLEQDMAVFDSVMQEIHDVKPEYLTFIKWVPQVSEKNYKLLPPHILAVANRIITVKPNSGKITVKGEPDEEPEEI